jgi:hypothetical protein
MDNDDDHGLARHTDPSTSHEAAEITKAKKLVGDICDALKAVSGNNKWYNCFELAEDHGGITNIKYATLTPRMPDLRDTGLVDWQKMKAPNDKNILTNLLHYRWRTTPIMANFDLGERIKQVREVEKIIEDKQEELDTSLAKHHEFVKLGRAEILEFLNKTNQKSSNTEYGGCHWKPKITYRVEDKDAFRRHVIGAEAWELITWASAPVNCEAFTEEHKMTPPGLVRNAVNILYITPPTKPKDKNKIVQQP